MRPIDADALKEEFNELRKSPWFNENTNGIIERASYSAKNEALNIVEELVIDKAPTIDDLSEYSDKLWKQAYERGKAEARPTGYWIGREAVGFECSNCQKRSITSYDFCPYCGSDMR